MSSEKPATFGSVSVQAGDDARVSCIVCPAAAPILSVCAPDMRVDIWAAAGERMTAEAVAFAAELAREAARFAAECQRLHAAQLATGPPRPDGSPDAASIIAGQCP
jgi:hypothetical protein